MNCTFEHKVTTKSKIKYTEKLILQVCKLLGHLDIQDKCKLILQSLQDIPSRIDMSLMMLKKADDVKTISLQCGLNVKGKSKLSLMNKIIQNLGSEQAYQVKMGMAWS